MAIPYIDLHRIRTDPKYPDWAGKVEFAISVSANQIADDAQSTEGKKDWARRALADPAAQRPGMEQFVLAENKGVANTDIILDATDAQIQTNVDKAVNALVPDTVS